MKMPWVKKENKRFAYTFNLKNDEFSIKTKFHAKTSAFVEFFNKMSKKAHVKESWGDVKADTWALDEKSKAAIEKKLLKAMNYEGILEKVKRKPGLSKLKPVFVKIDSVEYQKVGSGYDVRIEISGLQTGVE